MKKFLPAVLAAALAAASCSQKSGGPVISFRYWGDLEEIKIIGGLIRDFEAKHPGVKVAEERKAQNAQSYAESLMTEFAAGKGSDVIFGVAETKDLLTENNLLEDLNPYLDKEKGFSKKDFYPSMISRFSTDGKLYFLPRDIAPFACVYYNKSLFKQAQVPLPKDAWSWKEMREAALKISKLKSPGGSQVWGFVDDWPMVDVWIYSAGGSQVDNLEKPTRLTLDSPAAIKGQLFRWDLMFTDLCMPSSGDMKNLGAGGTTGIFMNGEAGMYYSGIWKTPSFRQIKDFDWDIAEFPKGPTGLRAYGTGGSGYSISKACKNKDLAWDFVRHMAGPEAQARMASTGLVQPALKKIAQSKVFLDGQKPLNKKMLLKAAERGIHPPATSAWLKYDGDIGQPFLGEIWIPGFERAKVEGRIKEAVARGNAKYFSGK